MLHVTEVRHVRDLVVWVAFDDGRSGNIDLSGRLEGEVFEPLLDESRFAQAYVDPELQTLAWPNGADLAPEFLRDLMFEQASIRRRG